MSFLFLDFDGVLNNNHTVRPAKHPSNYPLIDKDNAEALEYVLRKTKAQIVLSTAWRDSLGKNKAEKWLKTHGVISANVISSTPVFGEKRCDEILEWLKSNKVVNEAWAVVDDNDYAVVPSYEARCLITNPSAGLTQEDANILIKMLGSTVISSKIGGFW